MAYRCMPWGVRAIPGWDWVRSLALQLFPLLCTSPLLAADLEQCRLQFQGGQYEACAATAEDAIGQGESAEAWWELWIRALLTMGEYPEAKSVLEQALERHRTARVRLGLLGYEVYRRNGELDRAEAMLREVNRSATRRSWLLRDPANRVALGRAALLLGADPRQVLEVLYDQAKRDNPKLRDVYLATGEMALEKHDDEVAAQAFREGLEQFPDDPDLHFGLARAFASSDALQTSAELARTLQINPNHVAALLFQANHLVDAEGYMEAEELLEQVLSIDHWNPRAWAYYAVLAHLRGDMDAEQVFRSMALRFWKSNPEVDHLIGKKLSQKYRFAEGEAYQRSALSLDRDYLPAKLQLAQDLLRLGREVEGWRLAEEVHERDQYDLVSYNVVTLKDNIAKFRTLRDELFVVRMDPLEADLYGDRVLSLLRRAGQVLCPKYGLELHEPVTVEIFPQQSDFAVRTFGMPGGAGYLGVCFGKVITANSPASQGESPTNWESVLWHEFCHVVTLQLTHNKMPRWLSEGISVYEEREADTSWGERMNPLYRQMILDGELTPVGELSGAFLAPPSGLHLQFAYYESSLVVEYLVEHYGLESLKGILELLGKGLTIEQAIETETDTALEDIEHDFAVYARGRAEALAPQAELERKGLPDTKDSPEELARWLKNHPNSVWGLLRHAAALVRQQKWQDAIAPLHRAIELFPGYTGPDNAYALLATVHRNLGQSDKEREVLRQLAELDGDAASALLRLAELDAAAKDWQAVTRDAEAILALNPLLPQPHRYLAQASEALGSADQAIAAYRCVLLLEPEDPAEVHYRLARVMHSRGDCAAKRHVLMALEEAPRFPGALRLLLEIHRQEKEHANADSED